MWFLKFILDAKEVQYDQDTKKWVIWNEDRWIVFNSKEAADSSKNEDKDMLNQFDDFIKDLKSHSKMYVRLLSDCKKYDCEFSLSGSTAAINFVMTK